MSFTERYKEGRPCERRQRW